MSLAVSEWCVCLAMYCHPGTRVPYLCPMWAVTSILSWPQRHSIFNHLPAVSVVGYIFKRHLIQLWETRDCDDQLFLHFRLFVNFFQLGNPDWLTFGCCSGRAASRLHKASLNCSRCWIHLDCDARRRCHSKCPSSLAARCSGCFCDFQCENRQRRLLKDPTSVFGSCWPYLQLMVIHNLFQNSSTEPSTQSGSGHVNVLLHQHDFVLAENFKNWPEMQHRLERSAFLNNAKYYNPSTPGW